MLKIIALALGILRQEYHKKYKEKYQDREYLYHQPPIAGHRLKVF